MENLKIKNNGMTNFLLINLSVLVLLLFLFGCAEKVPETLPPVPVQEPQPATEPVEEVPVLEEPVPASVPEGANLTAVHTVYFTADGFEPELLNITKGDTVVWINQREKLTALVVGAYTCAKTRSPLLRPGDQFNWTFGKVEKCVITDGVFPAEILTIYVNE